MSGFVVCVVGCAVLAVFVCCCVFVLRFSSLLIGGVFVVFLRFV